MTTTVKIHVNGRYRAHVEVNGKPPVTVEGAYDGSPNPSGEHSFYLPHPGPGTFVVTEEWIDAPQKTPEPPEPA
jgi:hypothetical protein